MLFQSLEIALGRSCHLIVYHMPGYLTCQSNISPDQGDKEAISCSHKCLQTNCMTLKNLFEKWSRRQHSSVVRALGLHVVALGSNPVLSSGSDLFLIDPDSTLICVVLNSQLVVSFQSEFITFWLPSPPKLSILLCLMQDDFAHQWGTPRSQCPH